MAEIESHNKNINDRQQSWLDAQKAARPLYWRYMALKPKLCRVT
jgi:hypothetical protein